MAYTEIGLHIANNQQSPECAVFALRRANAMCCTESCIRLFSHLEALPKVSHGCAWATFSSCTPDSRQRPDPAIS